MDTTVATSAQTTACTHCHALNRVGGGEPSQAHCGKCGQALFEGHPVELDEASLARFLSWVRAHA